jgi:hypothetical protein
MLPARSDNAAKRVAADIRTPRRRIAGGLVKRLIDGVLIAGAGMERIDGALIAFRAVDAKRIQPEVGCVAILRRQRRIIAAGLIQGTDCASLALLKGIGARGLLA